MPTLAQLLSKVEQELAGHRMGLVGNEHLNLKRDMLDTGRKITAARTALYTVLRAAAANDINAVREALEREIAIYF